MSDEKPMTKAQKKYYAFLASPEWQAIRKKVFDIHGRTCSNCGTDKCLQVHHKSYVRKGGKEDIQRDLVVLCVTCHQAEHGLLTPEGRAAFEEAKRQRKADRIKNRRPRQPKPIRISHGKMIIQVPDLVSERDLLRAQEIIAMRKHQSTRRRPGFHPS